MKLYCPVCTFKCLSIVRKLLFGPLLSVQCRECGNMIGVSWVKSLTSLLPAFAMSYVVWFLVNSPFKNSIPLIAELNIKPDVLTLYAFAAGLVVFTIPLCLFWVSLELKKFCQAKR